MSSDVFLFEVYFTFFSAFNSIIFLFTSVQIFQ